MEEDKPVEVKGFVVAATGETPKQQEAKVKPGHTAMVTGWSEKPEVIKPLGKGNIQYIPDDGEEPSPQIS